LNTTIDILSRLQIVSHKKPFNSFKKHWKVDPFSSRKNCLLRKYTLVILSKNPHSIGNALKISWQNIHYPVLIHPPIPLILKSIQKLTNEGSEYLI
jgi:hypothetical protein